MTNKHKLSVGLSAATFVVALIFLAGSVLLNEPWFASLMAQTRLTLESFVTVFAIIAIILSIGAFVISQKIRSFVGAGLLAASGVIFMIHPLTDFMMHPQMSGEAGPILVLLLGLGILGLGVTIGIRTRRLSVAVAR